MKKLILLLFINILVINHLFSDEIINNNSENDKYSSSNELYRGGLFFVKMGYSFLGDYNINVGLDLIIFKPRTHWEWLGFPEHIIGINYKYQFTEKDSILSLNYTYVPYISDFLTFGLSSNYNINKQEFGLAPKIGLQLVALIFILDIDYKYNIIINEKNKNYHEIIFFISIPIL